MERIIEKLEILTFKCKTESNNNITSTASHTVLRERDWKVIHGIFNWRIMKSQNVIGKDLRLWLCKGIEWNTHMNTD